MSEHKDAKCCFCGTIRGALIRLYQGWCCVRCFKKIILEEPSKTERKFEVMMRYTFGTMEFPKEVHLGVYSGETKEEAIAKAREDPFVKEIEKAFKETGADWRGEKYLKFYAFEI